MAYVITNPEYLELAGVPLSTPAWEMTEASDLWSSPDVRGADLVIPGAKGVRPYPRRPTVTNATVEVAIVGDTSWDGSPYQNARAGLSTNVRHLEGLLSPAAAAADGTVQAVLHFAPGSPQLTRSGRVHVLRFRVARTGPNFATGQIELSIPAGALA